MTNATQNHLFTTRTQFKGKVLALAGISVMAVASLTACQKAPPKNESAASASERVQFSAWGRLSVGNGPFYKPCLSSQK